MNDNNEVRIEDVTFSEFDVDGVVAIGTLPLVKPSSLSIKPKLNLKNIKSNKNFNVKSLGPDHAEYSALHSYLVGYVGGMPYSWMTNLSYEQFKDLILDFLGFSQPDHLGVENHWLKSWGNGSANDINHVMAEANCFDVIVTPVLLTRFSNFVTNYTDSSQVRVLGAITWYGCKQDLAVFTPSLDHINADQVLASCIHVGLELKKPRYLLGLKEAPSSSQIYHPLGLKYFVDFTNDHEGALAHWNLEALVDHGLIKLRVYHPQLSHTRPSDLRQHSHGSRGTIAASAMLGSGAFVQGGAYKKLAEEAAHLKACLKGALSYDSLSGSPLRLEFVIKDIFVNFSNFIDFLRGAINDFQQMLLSKLGEIEITSIDLNGGINKALETLYDPNASIPKVAAAEAYLIFLVDGGVLRVFYHGLKAALGCTFTVALNALEQNHQYVKLANNFDMLSWEHCNEFNNEFMRKFSETAIAKWGVTDKRAAEKIFIYLNSNRDYTAIIKLIRDLEIIHQDRSSDHFLTYRYIQRTNGLQISRTATTLDVLNCVLYTRGQKGIKALSAAMLHTFLKSRGDVDIEKHHLAEHFNDALMNQLHFNVWPHSLPVSLQDRRNRFWKLQLEQNEDSFQASWALFQERCPISRSWLNINLSFDSLDQITARVWNKLSNWINANPNHRFLQSCRVTEDFRLVWVIVIMCVCHRNVRNSYDIRHPKFDWIELWTNIPNISDILNWMLAKDLVQEVPPNTPKYGTLLDHVIVPRDFMVRLSNLDEPTPPPSPTPDHELPRPIQVPDDNTHNDPEVMEVADDDQLQIQPLLDPQEQPPTPDPAPAVLPPVQVQLPPPAPELTPAPAELPPPVQVQPPPPAPEPTPPPSPTELPPLVQVQPPPPAPEPILAPAEVPPPDQVQPPPQVPDWRRLPRPRRLLEPKSQLWCLKDRKRRPKRRKPL